MLQVGSSTLLNLPPIPTFNNTTTNNQKQRTQFSLLTGSFLGVPGKTGPNLGLVTTPCRDELSFIEPTQLLHGRVYVSHSTLALFQRYQSFLFSNISKHGAGKGRQSNQKELVICGENPKVMFLGEKAGNQDTSQGIRTFIYQQPIKVSTYEAT